MIDNGSSIESKSIPSYPPLTGKRVRLRPVSQGDYEFLYDLFTREEHGFNWRFRGAAPAPEAFMQVLWNTVLCQFVVTRRSSGQRLGLVTAYNPDQKSAYVYLAMIMDPATRGAIVGYDATLLFINYLLRGWPFRKLYGETNELTMGRFFAGALGEAVQIEGRLRDHYFFDGKYYDGIILALYRDVWEPLIAQRLPRVCE